MSRNLRLPKTEAFYDTRLTFEVEVCKVCGTHGGKALQLDPDMLTALTATTTLDATLSEIASSALQFFQTSSAGRPQDHEQLIHLTNYEFGMTFNQSKSKKGGGTYLSAAPLSKETRHTEAAKRTVELFGYGLALRYMSKALSVSSDLFDFIVEGTPSPTKGGSTTATKKGPDPKADFELRYDQISVAEMLSAHAVLRTLNTAGQLVYVEVKCYTGWESFRKGGKQGGDLLANLANKAETHSSGCFVAVLVGMPSVSVSPRRNPKIMIADPNSPEALDSDSRLIFVLKRYLEKALRYGLWKTCSDISQWLVSLNALSESERRTVQRLTGQSNPNIQSILPRRTFHNRVYVGRVFSVVIADLYPRQERKLSEADIRFMLDNDELGEDYFGGINEQLADLIAATNRDGVLRFGVGDRFSIDLVDGTAFVYERIPMDDISKRGVRDALRTALGQ